MYQFPSASVWHDCLYTEEHSKLAAHRYATQYTSCDQHWRSILQQPCWHRSEPIQCGRHGYQIYGVNIYIFHYIKLHSTQFLNFHLRFDMKIYIIVLVVLCLNKDLLGFTKALHFSQKALDTRTSFNTTAFRHM